MSTSDPPAQPADYPDPSDVHDRLGAAGAFDAVLTEMVRHADARLDHRCSITLRAADGTLYTAASSAAVAVQLDELQYAGPAGPCVEAAQSGEAVFVPDMADDLRWAGFPEQAAAAGVGSSMSFPLFVATQAAGALNCYSPQRNGADPERRRQAARLADHAARALALGRRISNATAPGQLQNALFARSTVDRALGILMGQQRCTVEDAFELMRRTAQTRNLPLRDVAAQIVQGIERRGKDGRSGRY